MTDFLDAKRKEIQDRLKELRPLVDEFHRLEEATKALGSVSGARISSVAKAVKSSAAPSKPRGRRGRPRKSASAAAAKTSTRATRATAKSTRTKKRAATKVKATSAAGTGRRGRPRGSGTRANEALSLVKSRPGITIPELASAMKIKQNYLYRVMPGLADEGVIVKKGKGWHPGK